jgi:hypothetical protein
MEPERRPIGYWLKHLDRLIDQAFERALDADGLTRRHWQVLNTLAAGPSTNAALTAALQPFAQGDSMAIEVVINDFLGTITMSTRQAEWRSRRRPQSSDHSPQIRRCATLHALRRALAQKPRGPPPCDRSARRER